MVSPLVTIADFFDFVSRSNWGGVRQESARKANKQIDDLGTINMEPSDLPVSVTWLDAVAYCRDFERRTGLPVRLMTVEEWRQIAPPAWASVNGKSLSGHLVWDKLGWPISVPLKDSSSIFRPDGSTPFGPNLRWVSSNGGAKFLSVPGFGEWLSGFQGGAAPTGCVATNSSVAGGPIERDLCPVHMSMSYKGKVGFRLCYVAHLDA